MELSVLTDSDWASDLVTRRSTSGGVLKLGKHILNQWCRLQGSVSLSSGEAELNSLIKGSSECIGVCNLLNEMLDVHFHCLGYCDSSAARGIANRTGVGKVKHLSVKHMWIQEQTADKRLTVRWIPRKDNCSDALTHPLTGPALDKVLEDLDCWRPKPAPGT